MLLNPFTPSEIAALPDDLFGRGDELNLVLNSLPQGSVAIQGGIGVGKSSLLSMVKRKMEESNSASSSRFALAVGNKDIKTVDEAARLVLDSFVLLGEGPNTLKLTLDPLLEFESKETCGYLNSGRFLAALGSLVEAETLRIILAERRLLILAIDEADKCPTAITRLIRSLVTQTQQKGVKNVRFLLAGVSPFFQQMVREDGGISRFFRKTITLSPIPLDDAAELIETKLNEVVRHAEESGTRLEVNPDVITRLAALSGGHPHLLQLLGSYLVENEETDPDGIINSRDLVHALRRVCYEGRACVYEDTLSLLEAYNMLEALQGLLRASAEFPTKIDRKRAQQFADEEAIAWLVSHNILYLRSEHEYGLVDEFLRIRMLMDEAERESDLRTLEKRLVGRALPGNERSEQEMNLSEDAYSRGNLISIEGEDLDFMDPSGFDPSRDPEE